MMADIWCILRRYKNTSQSWFPSSSPHHKIQEKISNHKMDRHRIFFVVSIEVVSVAFHNKSVRQRDNSPNKMGYKNVSLFTLRSHSKTAINLAKQQFRTRWRFRNLVDPIFEQTVVTNLDGIFDRELIAWLQKSSRQSKHLVHSWSN